MKRLLPILIVILVLAAGTLRAEVPVNERRSVAPDALIELNLVAGTVKVTGWDKAEMELTGSLSDDQQKLEITGGKDRLKIEVKMPEKHHYSGGSDLVMRVPKGSKLDVETVSAPISVSDMTDRVQLNSVSGDLDVKGSPREVKLNTVSGEIALEDGESLENADFNSVSGSLTAHLRFRAGGTFSFNTVSGAISLRIPDKPSAEFEVSTFSGGISSDFGEAAKKSTFLPSEEMNFTLGSGGARVKVNSFSGPIKIRKE